MVQSPQHVIISEESPMQTLATGQEADRPLLYLETAKLPFS